MRAQLTIGLSLLLCSTGQADDGLDTGGTRSVGEIYFAFDSARLTEAATRELARMGEALRSAPSATVVLGGFADPRGTSAYNAGLSARRAEAARQALVGLGIAEDRLILGIHGEDGPRRERFALERRVAIRLTRDPLHVILDRVLPDAIAVLWSEPASIAEIEGTPIPVATR